MLERKGVYVATGSACAASSMRVSHVLSALGMPEYVATGSLRFTLGRPTTKDELTYAISCVDEAIQEEMQRMHVTAHDMQARADACGW